VINLAVALIVGVVLVALCVFVVRVYIQDRRDAKRRAEPRTVTWTCERCGHWWRVNYANWDAYWLDYRTGQSCTNCAKHQKQRQAARLYLANYGASDVQS
jgi:RNase P subunit RPR2